VVFVRGLFSSVNGTLPPLHHVHDRRSPAHSRLLFPTPCSTTRTLRIPPEPAWSSTLLIIPFACFLPSLSRSMQESHGLSPSLVETIAGFSAGVISTLAVHPLDIVKTRLQGSSNLGRITYYRSLKL